MDPHHLEIYDATTPEQPLGGLAHRALWSFAMLARDNIRPALFTGPGVG